MHKESLLVRTRYTMFSEEELSPGVGAYTFANIKMDFSQKPLKLIHNQFHLNFSTKTNATPTVLFPYSEIHALTKILHLTTLSNLEIAVLKPDYLTCTAHICQLHIMLEKITYMSIYYIWNVKKVWEP